MEISYDGSFVGGDAAAMTAMTAQPDDVFDAKLGGENKRTLSSSEETDGEGREGRRGQSRNDDDGDDDDRDI